MQLSNKWLEQARHLCGEISPEDGVDPRYLNKERNGQSVSYKTLQLCKEAAKVTSLILSGELGEPIIGELQVLRVDSEADGQFLRVSVGHIDADIELDEAEVLSALTRVKGYLRTAIAQNINRKRIPALKFRYVGLIEQGE